MEFLCFSMKKDTIVFLVIIVSVAFMLANFV